MLRPIAIVLALFASVAPAQDIDSFSAALNAQRAANGLAPLAYHPDLAEAATQQAVFMARNNALSHSGPGNNSVGDRVRAAGYCWRNVAENVALIPGNEAAVIAAWMGSDGHRRNILNRRLQHFGIARAEGGFWTLVLARGNSC